MRAAPPVEAMLNAGGPERMLICALHALAGAVVAAWLAAHAELGLRWPVLSAMLLAAALLAALGAWLARQMLPASPGRLRWDGQAWHIVGPVDASLSRLVVALDLGLWVLLRLHPTNGGAALWRIASAHASPATWHGLRVALASHAGPAARPAGDQAP